MIQVRSVLGEGEESTAADSDREENGRRLRVLSRAAQGDGKDDAEDSTLEKVDQHGHRDRRGARGVHTKHRADDQADVGHHENPAWLQEPLRKGS